MKAGDGIEAIFNFVAIDDRTITGGQPTVAQLEDVRNAGFEAVINLAPHDSESALHDERAIVTCLGLTYHHIPVEWANPEKEDFVRFCRTMEDEKDRRILIHCAANYRVTAFYSLYAMHYRGWSTARSDALIAKIWESRPDYRMDDIWRAFVDNIRREITGS